jgi:hypothetical protein
MLSNNERKLMNPIHILGMAECIHSRLERLGSFQKHQSAAVKEVIRSELADYWEKAIAIVWDTQDVHRLANGVGRCLSNEDAKWVLQRAIGISNKDDIGPHISEQMLEDIIMNTPRGRLITDGEQHALDHCERDFIIASEHDRFRVFNETDGVYCSPDTFAHIDVAKAFIEGFRGWYKDTGYKTASGEVINSDHIAFEIQLAEPEPKGGENENAQSALRCGAGGSNPEPAHQETGQ